MISVGLLLALPFLAAAAPSSAGGSAASASSFVGATSAFSFPPPGATITENASDFPNASQVGFPGPTPTGDEAEAIATAPALARVDSFFPLVQPKTADKKQDKKFNVVDQWGNLSPFQSLDGSAFGLKDASALIPDECSLVQVHLLHRHGARYPTTGEPPAMFAAKLHNQVVNGTGFSAKGPLSFLNDWEYKFGAEILTPFGHEQMFDLGVGFRVKYGNLLKGFTDFPVWRTTSEERMVDSALHFAAGFFGVQQYQTDYHQVIEIESSGFNSTLAPFNQCPNSNLPAIGGLGTTEMNVWISNYLNGTVQRLNKDLQGLTLNNQDAFAMQQLCAYETVSLGYSAFCDLFTEEEWKGFEYASDVSFWYGNGPGQPTNAAQGIGYVQEYISRITQTRITEFDTTLNKTIESSNITFPLNQPIFVDATHDTVISAIVTAFNFTSLAANGPLPTDHIPKDQSWIVTQIAPFGSNLVSQVLSCNSTSSQPTYLRWILNDGVLPLTGIQGCPEDKNGLCAVDTFVAGTKARIAEVDFQFDCFGNYTVPNPDNIVDGRAAPALKGTA